MGDEALRVEHLHLLPDGQGGRTLSDISFTLRRGEILGIAGLMGAGRTELLETLFGVHPAQRSAAESRSLVKSGGSPRRARLSAPDSPSSPKTASRRA